MWYNEEILKNLDSLPPEKIYRQMSEGKHGDVGSQNYQSVKALLDAKLIEFQHELELKRDQREERMVTIAEKTLTSASNQARWSKWAAIIATTAAIVSIKDNIFHMLILILN